MLVPANVMNLWLTKFQAKFKRDPDFLTRQVRWCQPGGIAIHLPFVLSMHPALPFASAMPLTAGPEMQGEHGEYRVKAHIPASTS